MLRLCICRCPPARSAKNGRRTTNDVANGPPFPSLLISHPVYLTPTLPTYPQQNSFYSISTDRDYCAFMWLYRASFFPFHSSPHLSSRLFFLLVSRFLLFSCSVFSLRLCVFSFLFCCVRYHYLTTPRRRRAAYGFAIPPFSFIALLIGSPGFSSLFLSCEFAIRYVSTGYFYGLSFFFCGSPLPLFSSSFFYVHDPHTRTRTCPIYACTHRHTYSLTYLRMSMNQTCTTLL